jgi:hypothetical protein
VPDDFEHQPRILVDYLRIEIDGLVAVYDSAWQSR